MLGDRTGAERLGHGLHKAGAISMLKLLKKHISAPLPAFPPLLWKKNYHIFQMVFRPALEPLSVLKLIIIEIL